MHWAHRNDGSRLGQTSWSLQRQHPHFSWNSADNLCNCLKQLEHSKTNKWIKLGTAYTPRMWGNCAHLAKTSANNEISQTREAATTVRLQSTCYSTYKRITVNMCMFQAHKSPVACMNLILEVTAKYPSQNQVPNQLSCLPRTHFPKE